MRCWHPFQLSVVRSSPVGLTGAGVQPMPSGAQPVWHARHLRRLALHLVQRVKLDTSQRLGTQPMPARL